MDINNVIKEILKQHKGGEIFFDHLDKAVQDINIVDQLLTLASDEKTEGLIVSGGFGKFLVGYLIREYNIDFPIICFNGGLRKGSYPVPVVIGHKKHLTLEDIKGMNLDFIDDSFYKGRTRGAVKKVVENNGAKLINTYVVYDGSKVKDSNVFSLYRYYDNFKGEE